MEEGDIVVSVAKLAEREDDEVVNGIAGEPASGELENNEPVKKDPPEPDRS
jgi:hypothetical protein